MSETSVLLSSEAEIYVEALKEFYLKDIGSQRWYNQHDCIEKLNMQAILSATALEDEFIKEYLITYEKIPLLIKDLLVTEIWKEKIFPKFSELDMELKATFPVYLVIYHEATVVNLLETVLFHKESCEAAGDLMLDLADYCIRKLTLLLARNEEEIEEQSQSETSAFEELRMQEKKLFFDIAIKTLSILRYMTDNLQSLPLSVCSRLLNTHDLPVLLVNLYRCPPWCRTHEGKFQKYIENKWQPIDDMERFHITKTEGQVLITLFHLLMEEECQKKYELDTYRKNEILKLRPFLTEVTIDQLPVMGELHRYLEQLAIIDPPQPKRDLLLEQVPEIRENILSANEGKWNKIAKCQHENYFNTNKADMIDQARRFAATYNFDALESLLTEPPKCAACGCPASKRCSRCQNEWYCRRECQVGHWKKHKKACDLLAEALKPLNSE